MNKVFQSKLSIALFLLLFVFITGVYGFVLFFEYSIIDAMYMTVITVSTVGFSTLHTFSEGEKIFTSILIVSSIFIFGYAIKVISEYLLSQNNIGNLKQKRVQKKINSQVNHIIVCGYGRNGLQAAQKLKAYNKPFVVIEKDEDIVNRYSDEDILFVLGDAIEDETLVQAGIDKASSLICALPSDADNLFIVLSARQRNKNLKIVSRATEETTYNKLKLAGADNVILPDRIGGEHMASLIVVPDLVEFLDNLSVSGEQDSMNVEQVPFDKLCPDGKEQAISDLDVRKLTGCTIIGYHKPNGEYIVNPDPSLIIEKNSKIILIGRPNQIESLKKLYHV